VSAVLPSFQVENEQKERDVRTRKVAFSVQRSWIGTYMELLAVMGQKRELQTKVSTK
jgi:hypothetical protein